MKIIFLSITIFLATISPAKASWTDMNEDEMSKCINAIYDFELFKIRGTNEILRTYSGSVGFGRDTAIAFHQYAVFVALNEAREKCGGDYKMKGIAYQLYKIDHLSSPSINDRLEIR